MSGVVAIMLIYAGVAYGGPATIQFSDLAACEAARPVIEKQFPTPPLTIVITKCVEVRK